MLLFFIVFPESAVGKETREIERHERQVKEHGFRVKARRNEGRKGRQMRRWCVCVCVCVGGIKAERLWKRAASRGVRRDGDGEGGGWLEGVNRGEAKSM